MRRWWHSYPSKRSHTPDEDVDADAYDAGVENTHNDAAGSTTLGLLLTHT